MDSTVITNFNKTIEIHRYQVKEEIDALITDNLGRPSYRVYRYLRDSSGTTPWVSSETFMITSLDDQVEVLENNLRFLKLHMPVKQNFTWRGNAYLPTKPYALFNFSNDNSIQNWLFNYNSIGESFTYAGRSYDNILSVEEVDENFNMPVTNQSTLGYKSRAVEKYAKNIGLVFREYTLLEYQPITSINPNTYWGFGIKKWMIDHN